MEVKLIKATFKGGPWDGQQFSVAEGQQFLVVKSLKNNDEENVDVEIEKYLYAVDAKYKNVFLYTPHTKEDLMNLSLDE
jgi:hypothetical protein